jgi:hypothetical protein
MLLNGRLNFDHGSEKAAEKLCGYTAFALKAYVFRGKSPAEQDHTVKAGKSFIFIIDRGTDLASDII